MEIAGGLYRELCCVPAWNALLGSGGRAAAAISAVSANSTLHAYAEDFENPDVTALARLGINMHLSPRPSAVVFSYFHPLSIPHIQPPLGEISRQPAIQVSGDAVLRFGFLEGDAVVDARRAVYDPQTWRRPAPFRANGSVARELAIVLNELELRSTAGLDDLGSAASHLIEQQDADVIVAKGGTRGATVFERGGRVTHIPAYRSSRVFKIGTGDVFSAIFAHHWAETGLPAVDAADIASRSVAAYCSTARLPPLDDALQNRVPVTSATPGTVLIEGAVGTIGQRYTMEEARFLLRELCVDVTSAALDGSSSSPPEAILVLADGLSEEAMCRVQYAKAAGVPIVVLREDGVHGVGSSVDWGGTTVTDDFVSALYFTVWATSGRA